MLRIGQPAVMGQLVAGILLGPSLLGQLWPDLQRAIFPPAREQKAMIDAVSQLGILLGKRGGDEGGDDTPALLAGVGQHIAHKVHAAALPGGVQ